MQCTHCGEKQRGSAGLTLDGRHYPLCHPDEGMDCYRLVTVYQHPPDNCPCEDGILPQDFLRSPESGYIGTFHSVEEAIRAVKAAMAQDGIR